MPRESRKRNAFTLIELLVVIVIIALLMAIAIPAYLSQQQKAKDSESKQYLTSAWKSARAAAIDSNGSYPVAATLIAEIQADHPHLSVTSASCGAATGTAKQIVIDPSSTSQNLILCSESDSGTIQRVQASPTSSPTFSTAAASGTPYSDAVLANSPALHWQLNETGAPATVADNSGNGRTGSVTAGGITEVAGPITAEAVNGAFRFTYGGGGRIDSAANAGVFGTTVFSIEAWVRPYDTAGSASIVMTGNSGGSGIELEWDGPGNRFSLGVGTGGGYGGAFTVAAEDAWHHVVITVNGTAVRMYLDGALAQNRTVAYSAPAGAAAFLRIRHQLLDEIAYYPTDLSLAQVQAHYAAATP